MKLKLPSPAKLGLPPHFLKWRIGQRSAILRIIDSPRRYHALVAPTGAGKSMIYAGLLRLVGGKSVILTSTKSLQDQLTRDFSTIGYHDVRGQSNYECAIDPPYTVDLGPCHAGEKCDLRDGGCAYYDAVARAKSRDTEVTVTNYSWWLHHNKHSEPFPSIDNLILDEAHAAPDELAEFLSCTITLTHIRKFLGSDIPPRDKWWTWAHGHATTLENYIEQELKPSARHSRTARLDLRAAKLLLYRLQRISQATSADWIMEEGITRGRRQNERYFRFDPVWPGPYAETLFRKTPRIVFVSATMRPKTLALLGLNEDDYDFYEAPSTFPVDRRPILHFTGQPRVALTYRSDSRVLQLWVGRIDNLIRRRLDRKGIIHCVSYMRRDFLLRNSRFADHFIIHNSGEQAEAVARFKAAKAPAIFLSPSATTGLDFPYSECEYQIIAKVPFPDLRSKILKARARLDPDYSAYLTMLEVVQASGRGMRAADDQCETFIVDDQWGWFKHKHRDFAPEWFLEACKRTERIPDPPPRLRRNKPVDK